MRFETGTVIVYALAALAFVLAFGPFSIGLVLAVLPGMLFSFFFLDSRKTVRVLLSVPLTIILVLVPTWILNIFSVPVNAFVIVFLAVVYSALFAFLMRKYGIKTNFSAKPDLETALILALVFSSVLMTYPLHTGLLPRTDGSSHYYKMWQVRESLDNSNTIPLWDAGWYAGYPLFDFYPPMSYYFTAALSYFVPVDLNLIFDYMIILSYIFLAVGVFVLSRELGLNKFSSFMAGLIVVLSPRLATNTMFSGQFPTILAFSLIPVSVYVFIRAFSERKPGMYTLSGLLLGANFLIHHLTGYFLATLLVLVFAVFSLRKNADVKGFLKAVLFSMLTVAFWIVPFFANIGFSEYSKKSVIGFNPDVFLVLTTSPSRGCADFYCFEAMGAEFTLLSLLGSAIWLGGVSLGRGKVSFSPKANLGSIIAVSMFLAVLLLALAPFIGITNYLPFGSSFGAERFTFYLILPLAILGGAILESVNGLAGKDFLVGGVILSVLLGVFLWKYIDLVSFRASDWNTEAAPLSSSGLSELYGALRSIPEGRVMTYGIFQGAIVGAIPVQAGKGVISGWQPQSSPNYKDVAGKLEDISGQSLFNFDVSNKFVYTMFQQSWTRWVVINLCSNEGVRAVNSTFAQDGRYLVAWRNENGQGCFVIIEVPGTDFAETVEPSGVFDEDQKIKGKIYDTENGYRVHFTKNFADISAGRYKIVINRDVVWDDDLATEIANIAASDPKPLVWSRGRNEIIVKNTTGWTLVKETYYPLWSAYNGNKKLDIIPTDLGFMLIRSSGDLRLRLEIKWYYMAAAVLTAAFMLYVLAKTLSEKPASHNADKEPKPVL